MKLQSKTAILLVGLLFISGGYLMAIEEAKFQILKADDQFELREYQSYILAETIVPGELEEASNQAFGRLFNYISGANQSQTKVTMTAPVSQESAGEKISMTTPVSQERMNNAWAVSFMMPAHFTESTIPTPDDPRVHIRPVPERKMAVIRYSGRWTNMQYLKHKALLEEWIQSEGLMVEGEAIWARFNAPFMPWFLKRNEIQIPVIDPNNPEVKS